MSIRLQSSGCVDVSMKFETAPESVRGLLRAALAKAVKGPDGGGILNFRSNAKKAEFTVKGQCETSADELVSAALNVGLVNVLCTPGVTRHYDPSQDKK
jgi:hypothetical protein